MTDDALTIRQLWTDSPSKQCKADCFCPLPEFCYNLTPQQRHDERLRRIEAGIGKDVE
jgi:hypothetical protein